MADIEALLESVAASRGADPLAPVTVIVPSHVAALQLRRRLGRLKGFAAVRFEMLPRLAELVAAGSLAAAGRRPLARPIGDHAARQVALGAAAPFEQVRDVTGFARALRQVFLRLRRGGVTDPAAVGAGASASLAEVLRLYGEFRAMTAGFYDPEDLLEAAAVVMTARRRHDLGQVIAVPPLPATAAGMTFLESLGPVTRVDDVDLVVPPPVTERFLFAPDPAAEVREVVRRVLRLLEDGASLDEIAVFHGAADEYRGLLIDAFAAANVPAAILPGTPLSKTQAGMAALLAADLPAHDYARARVVELLTSAAVRNEMPVEGTVIRVRASAWDRVSRKAGVTHGAASWERGLTAFVADAEIAIAGLGDDDDARRDLFEREVGDVTEFGAIVRSLMALLSPLEAEQPAEHFVARFAAAFETLVHPSANGYDEVRHEIEQLGTVGAIGGSFSLPSFVAALRANLDAGAIRQRSLTEGILVADYRVAAGLVFQHVLVCGAREGVFPPGPGAGALLGDETWSALQRVFPFIEDAATHQANAERATRRVQLAARKTLTWAMPLYESGGAHEAYPSALVVERARRHDAEIAGARQLRTHAAAPWLSASPSPVAAALSGPVVDAGELALRSAVRLLNAGGAIPADHPAQPALQLMAARRIPGFGPFDGNVAGLGAEERPHLAGVLSPSSLEQYASCGYRYFLGSVLHLRVLEPPEERETMEASERGTRIHRVLERFFREQMAVGRPRTRERWNPADRDRLLEIAESELQAARERGRAGLDVFFDHEMRTILYDLERFLEADSDFREETGAQPALLEHRVPPVEIDGVIFRGIVDRIDRDTAGDRAWVIDYKSGRAFKLPELDPFVGGTKLQLAAYSTAAEASETYGAYWFISSKGEFEMARYRHSPENRQRFARTLGAIVGGVSSGAFPAVPGEPNDFFQSWENCRFCDFTRICPASRAESQQARLDDVAATPWRSVAKAAKSVAE